MPQNQDARRICDLDLRERKSVIEDLLLAEGPRARLRLKLSQSEFRVTDAGGREGHIHHLLTVFPSL